jgi:hypothetical protein
MNNTGIYRPTFLLYSKILKNPKLKYHLVHNNCYRSSKMVLTTANGTVLAVPLNCHFCSLQVSLLT